MKNLSSQFKQMSKKFPNLSTFMVFGRVVQGKKYNMSIIGKNFDKLVSKGDYIKEDRDRLIDFLMVRAKEPYVFDIMA